MDRFNDIPNDFYHMPNRNISLGPEKQKPQNRFQATGPCKL